MYHSNQYNAQQLHQYAVQLVAKCFFFSYHRNYYVLIG